MVDPSPSKFSRVGPDALIIHLLQSMLRAGQSEGLETAQQKMRDFLTGIKKYQDWGAPPVPREMVCLWQRGAARLLSIGGGDCARGPVILVPSLINGWEILDLTPQVSLARFLASRGYDVHMIDWGNLRDDPDIKNLDDLLNSYLIPMVRLVCDTARQSVMMMGYCMGGLLMAGAMPHIVDDVRAQVFLATPWDFHAGDQALTRLARNAAPSVTTMLQTTDYLPNSQIQMLFAMIDADMALKKFTRFAALAADDPAAAMFVAVEDWLQTGRDLPRDLALACLHDWYLDNQTMAGDWHVLGRRITAKDIAGPPALVIAPAQDKLVPTASAAALATQMGRKAILHTPAIGHIGMMASSRAQTLVWDPLVEWMETI